MSDKANDNKEVEAPKSSIPHPSNDHLPQFYYSPKHLYFAHPGRCNPGNINASDENAVLIFTIDPANTAEIREAEDWLASFGYPLIRKDPNAAIQNVTYIYPEGRPSVHRYVEPVIFDYYMDSFLTPAAIDPNSIIISDQNYTPKDMSSNPLKRAASQQSANIPKHTKAADKIFDNPDAVLESEKSPIYSENVNLKAILTHPKAQESLRKAGIDLSQIPSEEMVSAIAQFKEDGRSGRHDPEWVAQASIASDMRKAGAFDEYQKEKFKEDWGEKEVETEGEKESKESKESKDGSEKSSEKVNKDADELA